MEDEVLQYLNKDDDVVNKLYKIISNTILNSFKFLNENKEYDYFQEALKWGISKSYFPELSEEEFLSFARCYDVWNDFEKLCNENK